MCPFLCASMKLLWKSEGRELADASWYLRSFFYVTKSDRMEGEQLPSIHLFHSLSPPVLCFSLPSFHWKTLSLSPHFPLPSLISNWCTGCSRTLHPRGCKHPCYFMWRTLTWPIEPLIDMHVWRKTDCLEKDRSRWEDLPSRGTRQFHGPRSLTGTCLRSCSVSILRSMCKTQEDILFSNGILSNRGVIKRAITSWTHLFIFNGWSRLN